MLIPRLAALVLAVPLAAQHDLHFYSPPNATAVFGDSASAVMFGSVASYASRTQQADGNWIGDPLLDTISRVAWRRDEAGSGSSVARTVDVEVRFGHTRLAAFSSDFASNYLGAPSVAFPRANLSLPDWTAVPALDDFDLVVPLATPFAYNRQDALLWEVVVYDSTGGGSYWNDWFSAPPNGVDHGQTLADRGPGCTTANGVFTTTADFRATPARLELAFSVHGAPASTAVAMLLGAAWTATVTVPGLCTELGTDAFLSVPLGPTDAAGAIPSLVLPTVFSPQVANLVLSTQAAALDPAQGGLPLALSNSTLTSTPRTAGTPSLGCRRTYVQSSATAATGVPPTTSAVPVRYTR